MGSVTMAVQVHYVLLFISLCLGSTHNETQGTTLYSCDPDYGWIPGVDGTKCYMIIRDFDYANCYFSSGDYYYGMTWFEAGSCCYANHGYPAEIVSQEEHDLVRNRLAVIDGEGAHTSYWLGGQDFFSEGEWRWGSGQVFSFTQWHQGEPNNAENEDCLSMSSQDGYDWLDLSCFTANHDDVPHYTVCEKRVTS